MTAPRCCALVATLLLAACVQRPKAPWPPPSPRLWVVDDGERVARGDGDLALARGEGNPVWSPGQPVRLLGLPGETVVLQAVVTAGPAELGQVRVEVKGLAGVRVERFVVADLPIIRRSGGKHRGESLGWARGAMPPISTLNPRAQAVPDPLIPVELAPAWVDYPLTVQPGEHRVVWIDLALPVALPAGLHQGTLVAVGAAGVVGEIPLTLEVGAVPLPYAAARTLVFYDRREILGRIGDEAAVRHYLQLMHRHHLSTFYLVNSAADVETQRAELSGALYTQAAGYEGPGVGLPAEVVALGTYGSLGAPTPEKVVAVRAALQALAQIPAPRREVFLYVADEDCDTPWRAAWRDALARSGDAVLQGLRLGQTCSRPLAQQSADVVMVAAGSFDDSFIKAPAQPRRVVWIYNGQLPRTGSFLTDGGGLSLRLNGWLQTLWGVERWFYWESTFWNDSNRGGLGPYDPLTVAETFHNRDGDHCNGDGVLVYPGRQKAPFRDLGFSGVLPSVRLKQWRRGIQDAAYLQLARAAARRLGQVEDPALREAQQLVGGSGGVRWASAGGAWFQARRRLFDLIAKREAPR